MVRDLRLALLLRVLSCAAWRHVCKRRASLSLVSTLLSQSPEFPWRPLVPCHSAWLETAGYHGRMYGACWYKAVHRRMPFIGTALNWFLFINVAAIIQHVFFLQHAEGLMKAAPEWNNQPAQFLVNQQC